MDGGVLLEKPLSTAGGTLLLLPGLLLAALGIAVAALAALLPGGGDDAWILAFGALLCAAGLLAGSLRSGVTFDPARSALCQWSGPFVPLLRRWTPGSAVSAVVVRRRNTAPSYKAPFHAISVSLSVRGRKIELQEFAPASPGALEKARALAALWARAVGAPVVEEGVLPEEPEENRGAGRGGVLPPREGPD